MANRGDELTTTARQTAERLRLPYAEPPLAPEPAALERVGRELACRLRVVPLRVGERGLEVAMADPSDEAALNDLQFRTGAPVEPVVAPPAAVDAALSACYGEEAVEALLTRVSTAAPVRMVRERSRDAEESVNELRRASEAPPIVRLVNLVLERALQSRASDVHIEPGVDGLGVRARVDGVLRELLTLPAHTGAAVVSRIKIMAGLDIATKRRPQDGRGAVRVRSRELGLRVSTLPSAAGEKVVLRLLDPDNAGRGLGELGLSDGARDRLARLLGRGHGVLLVTGPTGSGKTTTLYAALAALDREASNVVTLEDPIEYRLPHLTQVQVHDRAGLTFAAALRAVLRQDPDTIMVGEMRDRETVEVGMAAALTGHLVLSTLHTNDAPGAVARLVEMGAPPYLVAGGLIGVVAQRLARRLCPYCRAEREAHPAELHALGLPPRPVRVWSARGCERCDGEGYRGRVGIFELLTVDAPMRERILERAPADALREVARVGGMQPLGRDAWHKVRTGLTTLHEVRPLLTLVADEARVCLDCGTPLRAGFVVCPGCGTPLRRLCGCGAALEEGWEWCPACGGRSPPVP